MTQTQMRSRNNHSWQKPTYRAEADRGAHSLPQTEDAQQVETERNANWLPLDSRLMVLVVEDEPSIGLMVADVLEAAGYRVTLARDGREALTLAHRELPALVLTDRLMPELGGVELVRRLRANPATRTLPVALMSSTRPSVTRMPGARGKSDTLANTQYVEIDGELAPFLPKPFDLDELVALVQALAREPGSSRAPQVVGAH